MIKRINAIRKGVRTWLHPRPNPKITFNVVMRGSEDMPKELRDFIEALAPKSDYKQIVLSISSVRRISDNEFVKFEDVVHIPRMDAESFKIKFIDESEMIVMYEDIAPAYNITTVGRNAVECMMYLDWLENHRFY